MKPIRIVFITQHTALVRGIPAEQLKDAGVTRSMWCDPILCWAVPTTAIHELTTWAATNGRRVETHYAEIDR